MYKRAPASSQILNNGKPIRDYRFTNNWMPPARQFKGEFGLSVRYNIEPCFTLNAVKWTENTPSQENILAYKHLQRWKERKDPFWWSCLAHMEIGKRTVRSYQARRVRQAFVESLRKQGYAPDGLPLPDTQKSPLVGTAMLGAKSGTIKLKMDAIIQQTDLVVDMIMRSQRWPGLSRGQKTGKQSPVRLGKVDAGVAVLLTQDKRLIEFPSILLPPNISSGSIVDITVSRNLTSEQKSQAAFHALQDAIYSSFGESEPSAPVLRCRNATQTSVVLEWDPIDTATADCLSLSLFRNGQKAGNIPRPTQMQSTKISGLAVDTEYTFHLVLRTSAGTYSSEKVVVKTHKMTDLSGITVTPGILPSQLKDSLTKAIERIGAKIAPSVRIDTTHFVTTEGRGIDWEKAVEMNIPVVRPEWVEGCERGGRIVGVRQYYLDADPRQRQVPPTEITPPAQQVPEGAKSVPMHPPTNGQSNGTSETVPPTPPAKDIRKEDEEDSDSEEEETEKEKTAIPDEQKVRVEDRDQQKVALRPAAPKVEDENDSEEPQESEKQEKAAAEEGNGGSGSHTPGHSSFQDVAL